MYFGYDGTGCDICIPSTPANTETPAAKTKSEGTGLDGKVPPVGDAVPAGDSKGTANAINPPRTMEGGGEKSSKGEESAAPRDDGPSGSVPLIVKAWSIQDGGTPSARTIGSKLHPYAAGDLSKAESLLKKADLVGAIAAATRSIELHPDNPRAYNLRAYAKNLRGDHAGAERDAREALRLFADNAAGYRMLAFALLRRGDLRGALELISKAMNLSPDDALGQAIRAYIAEASGDHAGAISWMAKAASRDPRFRAKYESAKAGRSIYSPTDDDTSLLAPGFAGGFPWSTVVAGFAMGVGAAACYFLLGRGRLREARRIQLTPAPWASRRLADKYELGRLIGRGGMGAVFEATDHSLGRVVAVKKLDHSAAALSDASRARFVAEARAVAALRHPAIVVIHEIVEQEGEVYLVFELVVGSTVAQLLAQSGPLPPAKVFEILRPVCKALEFAHNKGFVHRDLKPANIMVTTDGEVKLMDFGLARAMSSAPGAATQTQTIAGTPVYMAPEVANGVVSREGDIYALGVTLYEMLTGTLPFSPECPAMARVDSKYQPPSVKVAGLPVELDRLVAAALEPNPVRRVKSAKAFLDRLKTSSKALSDTPVS